MEQQRGCPTGSSAKLTGSCCPVTPQPHAGTLTTLLGCAHCGALYRPPPQYPLIIVTLFTYGMAVIYHVYGQPASSTDKSYTINGTTIFKSNSLWRGSGGGTLKPDSKVLCKPTTTISAIVQLPPYDAQTTSAQVTMVLMPSSKLAWLCYMCVLVAPKPCFVTFPPCARPPLCKMKRVVVLFMKSYWALSQRKSPYAQADLRASLNGDHVSLTSLRFPLYFSEETIFGKTQDEVDFKRAVS